jgi:hypothetical protein
VIVNIANPNDDLSESETFNAAPRQTMAQATIGKANKTSALLAYTLAKDIRHDIARLSQSL